MDYYKQHSARWCTVHLMDLIQLDINCPDIYSIFPNGILSISQMEINPFKKQFTSFQKWPQIRFMKKTKKQLKEKVE